jgi:hypothetical protein
VYFRDRIACRTCHRLDYASRYLRRQTPGVGRGADLRNDAMKACVMTRTFRDGCERMRVDADHPPPAHDPVNAGHRPMQMTARVFENAASPAGDGVEIATLEWWTA